jgi:hypothetical protein
LWRYGVGGDSKRTIYYSFLVYTERANLPRTEQGPGFLGKRYLLEWVIPNFYFHVTTAYDILRHNGLEIGKKDYLGM